MENVVEDDIILFIADYDAPTYTRSTGISKCDKIPEVTVFAKS